MANLRSLIGSVSVNDIKPIEEGCSMYFAPHCTCYCNSDYSGNCYLYWCAPENATCMKFEVWGKIVPTPSSDRPKNRSFLNTIF